MYCTSLSRLRQAMVLVLSGTHPSISQPPLVNLILSSFPLACSSHLLHPTTVFPLLSSNRHPLSSPLSYSQLPNPQPQSPHHPNLPVAEFFAYIPPHPALHLLLSFLSSSPTTNYFPVSKQASLTSVVHSLQKSILAFVFSNQHSLFTPPNRFL